MHSMTVSLSLPVFTAKTSMVLYLPFEGFNFFENSFVEIYVKILSPANFYPHDAFHSHQY